MSKKTSAPVVASPWTASTYQLPKHGQPVVIEYATKDGEKRMCVGYLDTTSGWMLNKGFRLPDGCHVHQWMPIPNPSNFHA